MLRLVAAIAALAAAGSAQAQTPPKLTVVVVVDGLTPALLEEYRPRLTGGLARLAASAPPASALSPGGRAVAVSGGSDLPPVADVPAQQLWQYNGRSFVAGSASAAAPQSVALANSAVDRLIASAEPPLVSPPYCQAKAKPGGARLARRPGDHAAFHSSPSLDGATLALAAALVQELRLGKVSSPDLLSVGLAATGNVAGAYGSASEEMCLQLFALDRELGDFLSALDRMRIDYAVAFKRPD